MGIKEWIGSFIKKITHRSHGTELTNPQIQYNINTVNKLFCSELDKLSNEAKKEHELYSKEIKSLVDKFNLEISNFKEKDMAVLRLANLEKRITLLEIKERKNAH